METEPKQPVIASWLIRVVVRGDEETVPPTNQMIEDVTKLAIDTLCQPGVARVSAERVDQ